MRDKLVSSVLLFIVLISDYVGGQVSVYERRVLLENGQIVTQNIHDITVSMGNFFN